MIVDKINKYLSGKPENILAVREEAEKIMGSIFTRQFMKENSRSGIGLSSCGKCARQVAYGLHKIPALGKEMDSRSKIVFFQGDLTEMMIYLLAKLAGCPISHGGLEQKSVSLKIGDKEIFGHPDGIWDAERLIEIKSMSSYGFDSFQDGEIDDSYMAQINAYLEALGMDECIMVAMNKDNGVLGERIIKKNVATVEILKNNLSKIINSTPENLPERAFDKDLRGRYPWNCLYCSHWGVCLKAEKVLVKGRYKLKAKDD